MGAVGAIIMSFFGALFAAMTLALQLHWTGPPLLLPFLPFIAIAILASRVLRMPGPGIAPSARGERVILWSSIGEGVGLFVAANLVVNVGHRELLLPAMALVVGLHFLPMAWGIPFRPFAYLGFCLLLSAFAGYVVPQPFGGEIAGAAAAIALVLAALLAVRRDWRARRIRSAPAPAAVRRPSRNA